MIGQGFPLANDLAWEGTKSKYGGVTRIFPQYGELVSPFDVSLVRVYRSWTAIGNDHGKVQTISSRFLDCY